MISDVFTPKQIQALKSTSRILVLHGAKRTGKTYILIIKFLRLVASFKNKGYKFIIGGATSSTIQANILDDMGAFIGKNIKLDRNKTFELFGNKILVRAGANSDSWKGVRGFTAHGCLLNEGTALHDTFVKECISRCSGEGARIYIDTNPENPFHTIKTDYIDKAGDKLENGQTNIEEISFQLADNTFLDPVYVESIRKSTPSGMFYDRDIMGLWVNAQGVVYKDFDSKVNIIDKIPDDEIILEYVGGIDWGFEHYGSITVCAYTQKGNYYLVEEITKQHKYVDDYWLPVTKELEKKYPGIIFFCDSARPEYYSTFLDNDVEIFNGDKSVVPGIECVSSLFKTRRLFFIRSAIDRLELEISGYVWSNVKGKEEPIKEKDDALD